MGEVVKLNRTIHRLAAPKSDTNSHHSGYQEADIIDTEFGTNGYQSGTTIEQHDTQRETSTAVGEGSSE
jgi:hypothetical protein